VGQRDWLRLLLRVPCDGGRLGASSPQRGPDRQIYRLNQALDIQMAEAHLSDFVQRSSDLLVVVKDRQRYSFVSSASQTVLNAGARLLRVPCCR